MANFFSFLFGDDEDEDKISSAPIAPATQPQPDNIFQAAQQASLVQPTSGKKISVSMPDGTTKEFASAEIAKRELNIPQIKPYKAEEVAPVSSEIAEKFTPKPDLEFESHEDFNKRFGFKKVDADTSLNFLQDAINKSDSVIMKGYGDILGVARTTAERPKLTAATIARSIGENMAQTDRPISQRIYGAAGS